MSGGKRDTGIESIGRLPNGWRLQRLSNVADLFGRIGWQGLTSDEYTDEGAYLVTSTDFVNGCVNWDTCVHVSEKRWEEAWQIKLSEGDLLISKDGTIGKLAIVKDMPGHASLNSGLMRIVPKSDTYETRFLFYVLQTDVFTDWYRNIDSGASTIKHLFQGDFVHFVFPLPPVEEQRLIVREIDSEVSRLDHAISLIEEQVSMLEDHKRSLIQEIVTKGLNPSVPMRDSGVDWIGQIPSHWSVKRLKYLCNTRNGLDYESGDVCGPDDDGAVLVFRSSNIQNGQLVTTGLDDVYVSKRVPYSLSVLEGDLLIVRTNGSRDLVGKSALVPTGTSGVPGAFMLLCRSEYNDYLYWVLNSCLLPYYKSRFMSSTINQLSNRTFASLWVPFCPDRDERDAISQELARRIRAINKVVVAKTDQLDVLQNQRQSLIYEYVTGKRRVEEVCNG